MRRAAAAVLALVLLVPGAVVAQAQEPNGEGPPELTGRWVKIPNAPWGSAIPAYGEVDGKMLVVDRETGRVQTYDPDTRRWERGTRAPRRMQANNPWVWTGEELIVFDRRRAGRNQAYDPRTDVWRALAASPLPGHDLAISAGGQIMVAHFGDDYGPQDRTMAVYDLVTDSWTAIEDVPDANSLASLQWTGSEVLAVTSGEQGEPVRVTAYDPAAGTWGEPVDGPLLGLPPEAVWAEDRLVFASAPRMDLVVDATYDPVSMTWETRDYDCPLDSYRAIWTGEFMLSRLADYALEPSTGDCYRLPTPDFSRSRKGSPALWLEDRAMYWTGSSEEGVPYRRNGVAFIVEAVPIAESE